MTNIQDDIIEKTNPFIEKIKKIMIWTTVICISIMLILVIIFQPRFYTFIQ